MSSYFKETQPYEEGFANYFESELVPLLNKVERHRKDALKRFIAITIACIIAVILLPILVYTTFGDEEWAFGSIFFFGFGALFIISNMIKKFKDVAVSKINEVLVKFFGDFGYKREHRISDSTIDEIDFMLPDYEDIYYEDFIYGTHNGNKIEFCEARVEQEYEDSEGDTHTKVVFKGLFVILTFQKAFAGKTFIVKDRGRIMNYFKKTSTNHIRVELANKEFDRLYEVYTTNLTETESILSNLLQYRLMKLAKNFNCKSINCCFFSNKVFFAIPVKKNLFESVSLFESAFSQNRFKTFLRDFNLVLNISDGISEQLLGTSTNYDNNYNVIDNKIS